MRWKPDVFHFLLHTSSAKAGIVWSPKCCNVIVLATWIIFLQDCEPKLKIVKIVGRWAYVYRCISHKNSTKEWKNIYTTSTITQFIAVSTAHWDTETISFPSYFKIYAHMFTHRTHRFSCTMPSVRYMCSFWGSDIRCCRLCTVVHFHVKPNFMQFLHPKRILGELGWTWFLPKFQYHILT